MKTIILVALLAVASVSNAFAYGTRPSAQLQDEMPRPSLPPPRAAAWPSSAQPIRYDD